MLLDIEEVRGGAEDSVPVEGLESNEQQQLVMCMCMCMCLSFCLAVLSSACALFLSRLVRTAHADPCAPFSLCRTHRSKSLRT